MKRWTISLVAVFFTVSLFGCASNDASSSISQSSYESTSDAMSDATSDVGADLHGIASPISEPPIACTKKAEVGNVSVMIPEDWSADISIGGYLAIETDNDVVYGTIRVDESDMDASNRDDEIMTFVNDTMESVVNNGFIIGEGLKVERKGDLAYVIVPFSAVQQDQEGKDQSYWGYSLCGYDNELIIADFSSTEQDNDILQTFRWILENIQVG